VSGDHLLVGFCNGVLRSFDRNTGKLEWEYDVKKETGENSFHAAMVVSGDMLIAATELTTGSVYAFACDTCRVIWRRPCGPGVFTDLISTGERVFVHTLQDSVLCLDRSTGRTLWAFADPGAADTTGKGPLSPAKRSRQHSPALAGDKLLYVDDNGTLHALRMADGRLAWERRFEEPVMTSVSLSHGIAYVGTRDKVFHGVVPATGELKSHLKVPGLNWTPLSSGDRGMVGWAQVDPRDSSWQFVAYDRDMSRLLWMKPPPDSGSAWGTFRPPIVGRLTIAGTNHGHMLAYDLESGALAWEVQIEDRSPRSIVEDPDKPGRIYVGTGLGTVYAFDGARESESDRRSPSTH
jgi:outer membrane protein assembly factor BamB